MKKMAAERRDSDPRVIQLQLPSGGGGQQVVPELRVSQGDPQSQEQDQQQQDNLNLRLKDLKLDPSVAAARTSPISPQNVPLPPPNPLIMMQLQQQQQAAALQHLARQQQHGSDPL